MKSSAPNWLLIATIVAVLAALLGTVADTFLLYNPAGGYFAGDYAFLGIKTKWDILIGHYLGVFAIPFEAAGLLLIFRGMLPGGKVIAWSSVILGILIFMPGVAYHASVFPLWQAIQTSNSADLAVFQGFSEPLAVVFVGGFFLLFLGFCGSVFLGKTAFPKWIVLFSPIVTYGIWFLLSLAAPSIGNFLLPMGFNLSMAIFYAMAYLALRKSGHSV